VVEQEQRVIAGAAEVAVVGRAFLVALGRADAGVHVENHIRRRLAVVNPVDPSPRQVGKGGNVVVGGQELGLEAAHLAGRCRQLGDGPTANDPPRGGITPKAVSVVHILVAAEPSERGLAEQAGHAVLAILAGPRIDQMFTGNLTQSKSVVEFPEGKEARVRGDLGTVKFQLQPTVEIEP